MSSALFRDASSRTELCAFHPPNPPFVQAPPFISVLPWLFRLLLCAICVWDFFRSTAFVNIMHPEDQTNTNAGSECATSANRGGAKKHEDGYKKTKETTKHEHFLAYQLAYLQRRYSDQPLWSCSKVVMMVFWSRRRRRVLPNIVIICAGVSASKHFSIGGSTGAS